MSVLFAKWNFDGRPADGDGLEKVVALLSPYGPDGTTIHNAGSARFVCCAFHTTRESRLEVQPLFLPSQTVIVWDGRLDSRDELARELDCNLDADSTDLEIVGAAYQRWGSDSFAKLIGDWALSVWDPKHHSLVLAKDVIGARPLYYSLGTNHICWSTLLDPLVLLAGGPLEIDEEYVAAWTTSFPRVHLTPYVGIHSVPPASFVEIRPHRVSTQKYWNFDCRRRIRYCTDREYEQQFLSVFQQSVRRRLRSDRPVLAELSGGVDSSSVVCMADTILAAQAAPAPRLDTISYFNDSEPNWNERPYFEKVEAQRGRKGWHVTTGESSGIESPFDESRFVALPGVGRCSPQFRTCLVENDNRVLLSGIGGDEVLGGVPNPVPELADYLRCGQFAALARQSVSWALAQRRPLWHVVAETLAAFSPFQRSWSRPKVHNADWFCPRFQDRCRSVADGCDPGLTLFGPLPTFQANLATVEALRRQIACVPLATEPPHDRRYPYLDRDLLEFLFAIPREQLLRPNERRSLMRRSLSGIVPKEVLGRRRKAFVVRSLMANLAKYRDRTALDTNEMVTAELGMVNAKAFREALYKARQGQEVPLIYLARTVEMEGWLQQAARWGVLKISASTRRTIRQDASSKEVSTCANI